MGTCRSVTHCFNLSVGTLGGELSEVEGGGWKVGVLARRDQREIFTKRLHV